MVYVWTVMNLYHGHLHNLDGVLFVNNTSNATPCLKSPDVFAYVKLGLPPCQHTWPLTGPLVWPRRHHSR